MILTSPQRLIIGGLLLGVILFQRWYKRKISGGVSFQYVHLLPGPGTYRLYLWLYRSLLISTISSAFLVLAYPKRITHQEQITTSGIDIVLALDVSYSMEANDLQPNRLHAAKTSLQHFLSTRVSDRVGLVLFAGKPFVGIPLTLDYPLFSEVLSTITGNTIDQSYIHLQGTAIGDALLSSIALLEKDLSPNTGHNNTPRERLILLFTDGEANIGVDPLIVAQLAKEKGIVIHTIGIGSYEGGVITTKTSFGSRQQRVNGVDEITLRKIADSTNGLYARAVDSNSLKTIIDDLANRTKSEIITENYTTYHDARGPFVIICVICMLGIVLLERRHIF